MFLRMNKLFLNCKNKLKFVSPVIVQNVGMATNGSTDIVWMDLEMTGLDVRKDKIIEISCLITDKNLNIKSDGCNIVINYPKEVFDNMNDWCKEHHNNSGLVQQCLNSKITIENAQLMLLEYIKKNIPERSCPLGGSSIYMDRMFLREHMPSVDNYLHYRIIDVSTIKELCRRWNPSVAENSPIKKLRHRSLDDIMDSIEELKYYEQHFFKKRS